jgi:cellulose 1,4-beta-cellobiosidase
MKSTIPIAALLSILPAYVAAQSGAYGQCGGTGWSGATSCVSGYSCTYSNPYYSQCLPGGSGSTTTPSSGGGGGGTTTVPHSTSSAPATSATPSAGNPYLGKTAIPNPFYTQEVIAAAANITDAATAALAAKVETIPTFFWLDQVAKVPTLGTYLAQAAETPNSLFQIVIYDLPNRDCAAAASNGEFTIADNGVANYENYIDQIVAQIKLYPSVTVVAVVEPDSLANLVTNLSVAACSAAQTAYLECVQYAIQQLSTVNVHMYIDAGHAGWLGWPANLQPAANLFAQVLQSAGTPNTVRGLSTNVANYNALQTNSPDPITAGNPNYDEYLYITALAPLLIAQGFPANFIVDQGRSGQQNLRAAWGDWCNVDKAGFGIQPTTDTPSPYIDAVVWVKPGGECDGTSNTSAPRYDYHCSLSDAMQPAPQAGTWFQAYFENLVTYANPAL